MRSSPTPTRLTVALLAAALPDDLADAVVGDLLEEFRARATRGPSAARRWLFVQILRSAVPFAVLRLRRADPRVATAALALSSCAGYAVAAALRGLWARMLSFVPLRAGHGPTEGWNLFGAALIVAVGALGALCGAGIARWYSRRRES